LVTPLPICDGASHEIFNRPLFLGTTILTVLGALGAERLEGGGVGFIGDTFVFNIRFDVDDPGDVKVPE
jgi:hypothetical protein